MDPQNVIYMYVTVMINKYLGYLYFSAIQINGRMTVNDELESTAQAIVVNFKVQFHHMPGMS